MDRPAEWLTLFRDLAAARGGQCLSETYVKAHAKMRWRCAVGHEFEATANTMEHGRWCPECSAARRRRRRDATTSEPVAASALAESTAIAVARGGLCTSERFIDEKEPLSWRCAERHKWLALPAYVRSGKWCPYCDRYARLAGELRAMAAAHGGECITLGPGPMLLRRQWRCRIGHVFTATANAVERGQWCTVCRLPPPGTLERIREIAARRGGECLSTEYVRSQMKLRFRCRQGHEWEAEANRIVQGAWCYWCTRSTPKPRLGIDDMRATAETRGGRCLSPAYGNWKSKLRWQCAFGHEWEAVASQVRHGSWCPECAHRYPGTIEGMRALGAERGGRCLSNEYNGHRTVLLWECAAGHQFEAAGMAVKSGAWCPRCRPQSARVPLQPAMPRRSFGGTLANRDPID